MTLKPRTSPISPARAASNEHRPNQRSQEHRLPAWIPCAPSATGRILSGSWGLGSNGDGHSRRKPVVVRRLCIFSNLGLWARDANYCQGWLKVRLLGRLRDHHQGQSRDRHRDRLKVRRRGRSRDHHQGQSRDRHRDRLKVRRRGRSRDHHLDQWRDHHRGRWKVRPQGRWNTGHRAPYSQYNQRKHLAKKVTG